MNLRLLYLLVASTSVVLAEEQAPPKEPTGKLDVVFGNAADPELKGLAGVEPRERTWNWLLKGDGFFGSRISPDRRYVAHGRYLKGGDPENGIYVSDLEGRQEPRLLLDGVGFIVWSSDSKEMIISRTSPARHWRLETVRLKADGSDRRNLAIGEKDVVGDWSRDGRWLLVERALEVPSGESSLTLVHPDGSGSKKIGTGPPVRVARLSPDGRTILGVQFEETGKPMKKYDVLVMDFEGNRRSLVRGLAATFVSTCWSPDASWIAFSYLQVEERPPRKVEGHLEIMRNDGTERREIPLPASLLSVNDWR